MAKNPVDYLAAVQRWAEGGVVLSLQTFFSCHKGAPNCSVVESSTHLGHVSVFLRCAETRGSIAVLQQGAYLLQAYF